ncbi:MAG: Bifunctional thiamine biosynthesis protein ThiDN [Candidatus Methanolliviera sp. GoM_oil]|nr:MAG: Bifunctional thiamine biosynthesis protein ThiDN [Candidatus Methanolliviera sp. GoM_oil]
MTYDLFKNRDRACLTIGGSDSSGGAGIQADIKTFSSFNFSSASVITALTAQNSKGVLGIYPSSEESVIEQLKAVFSDDNIYGVKTGMLYSPEIISSVADFLSDVKIKVPIIVDPVMSAEAGGDLIKKEAIDALKEKLIPISSIITPNVEEAEKISGMRIKDERDAEIAAKKIYELGTEVAIVTGGHLKGRDIFYNGKTVKIDGKLIEGKTHGSGCTYSSSLTCLMAMGYSPLKSAIVSKRLLERSIEMYRRTGDNTGCVNQTAWLLDDCDRYYVMDDLKRALEEILKLKNIGKIIPEVGSNLGMAIHHPKGLKDIAAVEGRITKCRNKVRAGCVSFGASEHVARTILTVMKYDENIRSAMNIKFSEEILDICKELSFSISYFDRKDEPKGAKTMEWGIAEGIKNFGKFGKVPEIIFDRGGIGKEPMIRIFGGSSDDVVEKVRKILVNV